MGSKTTTQVMEMPEFQQEFLTEKLLPVAEEISTRPFQAYTGERVAQPTELQEQAYQGYGALSLPSEFQQATDVYQGIAQRTPQQRQEQLSQIQTQMAPMLNRRFAQQGVGQEAQAIKAGAFGDRRDVYEGERQAALDASAYNLAAQELARQDQQAMQTAQALAGQGLTGLQTQQAILGAQMGAGEARRVLDQQGLDVGFEEFMRQQNYPLTQFGVLTGAAGAIPSGYGTTTSTQRDPLAGIGMGLQAFGGLGMAGMGPFSGLRGSGLTSNPFPF